VARIANGNQADADRAVHVRAQVSLAHALARTGGVPPIALHQEFSFDFDAHSGVL
jgi:hypothetical protein